MEANTTRDLNPIIQISLQEITLGQDYTQRKYENGLLQFVELYYKGNLIMRDVYYNRQLVIEKQIYDTKKKTCMILKYYSNLDPNIKEKVDPTQLESKTFYAGLEYSGKVPIGGYIDGEMCEWYPNGQIKRITSWIKGVLDGTCKLWYPTGVLLCEVSHVDGKLDGICRYFHENGQPKSEYSCVAGNVMGPVRKWGLNGEVQS